MSKLVLPLNGIYFDEIKAGTKLFEYRLRTPYWRRRLEGRMFDAVVITKGYPPAADTERRMEFPWRGYEEQTITHPFFGPAPVDVFAIRVGATKALTEQCKGDPGECAYNGACMYACGSIAEQGDGNG